MQKDPCLTATLVHLLFLGVLTFIFLFSTLEALQQSTELFSPALYVTNPRRQVNILLRNFVWHQFWYSRSLFSIYRQVFDITLVLMYFSAAFQLQKQEALSCQKVLAMQNWKEWNKAGWTTFIRHRCLSREEFDMEAICIIWHISLMRGP